MFLASCRLKENAYHRTSCLKATRVIKHAEKYDEVVLKNIMTAWANMVRLTMIAVRLLNDVAKRTFVTHAIQINNAYHTNNTPLPSVLSGLAQEILHLLCILGYATFEGVLFSVQELWRLKYCNEIRRAKFARCSGVGEEELMQCFIKYKNKLTSGISMDPNVVCDCELLQAHCHKQECVRY